MKFQSLLAVLWAAIALAALPARATIYDATVEPSPDNFWYQPEVSGVLQTSQTGDYDNGQYYYVYDWGGIGFGTALASARVYYDLPPMPSGEHLYNVYAWNPAENSNQWHAINANADGTDSFPMQQISWTGQFGTNRQWIAFGADTQPGGQWIRLGPGPQMDSTAYGGRAFRMNPFLGPPRLYTTYQPWYNGAIAWGAVRVVRAPDKPGDVNFDGVVNIFDINIVSTNWSMGPEGDANGDLLVNIFDINVISANWTTGAGVAVPEPSALVTAALGFGTLGFAALGLTIGRRRRNAKAA